MKNKMKRVHLITSTYNDIHRFDWKHLIDFSEVELFLYRKCDDLEIGESRVEGEFIDIPNYGSCDYAFFNHIVNNYDNLGDTNIFTKLNVEHCPNFEEFLNNSKEYDFYQSGISPVSQIWYNEKTKDFLGLNTKYQKQLMNSDMTKEKKPKYNGTEFNGSEYEYVGNADGQIDWFNYLYGGQVPPGEICTYEHGPYFSVSKELILRHPKSTYQHFLNMFHPCESWNYEIAKEYFYIKHKKNDLEFQTYGVGRHYHDELCRFYTLFFTYGIDKSKYNIYKI